jgi:hypothetical protein
MEKPRMLIMIGVAVIVAGAFGLWARRGSQAPPAAEQTELQWPAGSEGEAGVGFHTRVRARVVKGSAEPVARTLESHVAPVYDAGRTEEEEQTQEDPDFMALQSTALHGDDPDDRIEALDLLGEYDADRVGPILLQVLSDPDPQVRAAAVEGLSWSLGAHAPFGPLEDAAYDADPQVRIAALDALDQLDDARRVAVIQNALRDPDEDVRDEAESCASSDSSDDNGSADDEDADD